MTTYRSHRLEVFDDQGDGWQVVIHPPVAVQRITLHNRVPSGLAILVAEARARVDRCIMPSVPEGYP